MFEALPASFRAAPPRARVVTSAFLFHAVLIGLAIKSTASSGVSAPQVARDTIRVELAVIDEPPDDAPPPVSAPPMPPAPSVPSTPTPAPGVELPPVSFRDPLTPEAPVASPAPNPGIPQDVVDSLPSTFRSADVDELPHLLSRLDPEYPDVLRRAGVGGAVDVEYVVGPDGKIEPGSMRVLATDHPQFTASVAQALRGARFKAARRGGQSVAVLVRQTIRFRSEMR
jgi:periplasmic protein TonB